MEDFISCITTDDDVEITSETIEELSNGKGDDEPCQTAD